MAVTANQGTTDVCGPSSISTHQASMGTTMATSAKEIQDTIAQFGLTTLRAAAIYHFQEGEGATAISNYTGIPIRSVSRALRVQECIAVITQDGSTNKRQ